MNNDFSWRSMLFVPVTNARFVESAMRRPADALLLDLEDSIAFEDKEHARQSVAAVARQCSAAGYDVIVRVNRPLRMLLADLSHAIDPSVRAITLPKMPNAQLIQEISDVIADIEAEKGMPVGQTRLIAMVEDAEGLANIGSIAAAHSRLLGLIVGAEDLAVSLRMAVDEDTLYVPNTLAVAACRRAGIAPIGFIGSVADFTDMDDFQRKVERAARLGFEGAFCIHPGQVTLANAAFAPSPAAVERARALIAEARMQAAQGNGACRFEGRMVDAPVIHQAEHVLAKARKFGLCP